MFVVTKIISKLLDFIEDVVSKDYLSLKVPIFTPKEFISF